MALIHPVDLDAWHRWQQRGHPLRRLRHRWRPAPTSGVLTVGSTDPDLLVVLESGAPSSVAALLAPLEHVDPRRVAVLAHSGTVARLPRHTWRQATWTPGEPLGPIRAVLTTGHYLPLGAAVHAQLSGVPFVVAQHGLLTPHQPPLPPSSTLLAWSRADAELWVAGRADVRIEVVGSQLLWEAGQEAAQDAGRAAADHPDPAAPPTYLGQLHGAELPRRDLARAAEDFCRATGATYRPHPAETDRRSRRTHARWERSGIHLDRSGRPLASIGTGVVSVFSTGVLEAAARGLPAWVDFPDPPSWLAGLWARHAMARWGGEPTPPPARSTTEPARLVARLVSEPPTRWAGRR